MTTERTRSPPSISLNASSISFQAAVARDHFVQVEAALPVVFDVTGRVDAEAV